MIRRTKGAESSRAVQSKAAKTGGIAERVGFVAKVGVGSAYLPVVARLLCVLAITLLPAAPAAAQQRAAVHAVRLTDGQAPLGVSAVEVLRGMAPLRHHRVSSPIFWAAADYGGTAAFLADSLYRHILRMPILDSLHVFDEHFSVPDGALADRGIYGIDFYFLGSPSEPGRSRLFIVDTSLNGPVGSMDAAFSGKVKSMTRRLAVSPTDLRTSYDLLGANLPQGVDIAAWKTGRRVVFLIMAANAFDGTVSDAQVVCVDRDLWNEYGNLTASNIQGGGRG